MFFFPIDSLLACSLIDVDVVVLFFILAFRDRTHITPSRLGGLGGPRANDDIDDALRGGGGV